MTDKNDRTPWWLLYLSPSIIPMLPFIVLIFRVPIIVLTLFFVRWMRDVLR